MRLTSWLLILGFVTASFGQQVTVGIPLRGGSSGHHEHLGIGFGFERITPDSMMFFRSGTSNSGQPAFGGFDWSSRQQGWNWYLNFSALQGSDYSNVSTTPFLTLPHGGVGFVSDSVQRPFVTSFVPVVNGQTFEQRQIVLKHFEEAAARYRQQQQKTQLREDEELALLQAISKARVAKLASRSKHTDDAPLRLGGLRSEYAPKDREAVESDTTEPARPRVKPPAVSGSYP